MKVGQYITPYANIRGEAGFCIGTPHEVVAIHEPFIAAKSPFGVVIPIDTRDVYVQIVTKAYFDAFEKDGG